MVKYAELVETVNKSKIKARLKTNFRIRGEIEIDDEGLVTLHDRCTLTRKVSILPAKFKEAQGIFDCSDNILSSLEGAPQVVSEAFYAYNNRLTSLQGAPQSVGGGFFCASNRLTSLEGAPQSVGGAFSCSENNLTSLDGLPNTFSYIRMDWNATLPLLRLVGKKVTFNFEGAKVELIINKYQNQATRANILACQKELIDAGFEGNASW